MSDGTIRIGKVSSINYAKGTARVTYEDRGNATTSEFSFLAWEYWMPKIGDQVAVAHVSNGSSSAVILGPTWNSSNRPAAGAAGIFRKELASTQGTAYIQYDANSDALTVYAGGCTLVMSGGKIKVNGDVVANGISHTGHTHSGVHGETSGPH